MVKDNTEQHANQIEAYALEDRTNRRQEGHNAAHGGIWVDRTFALDNNVV